MVADEEVRPTAGRSSTAPLSGWGARVAVVLILLVGAAWRVPALSRIPPGLHQDEAVNAWNAYCLLKTGRDQTGTAWPVFYMRALGGYRSILFAYWLIPFQAVGGMTAWTSRLPAAMAGLATILLLYWTGARLFGRGAGLAAALLLALSPVHIQMSRYGNETTLTPLLTLAPFAALLWAGWPPGDSDRRLSWKRSVLAGLVTGVCCYGYGAVRLFVPVYLAGCVLVTWSAWRGVLRGARAKAALLGLSFGASLLLAPLAWKHVTEPHIIGKRARATWVWDADDPVHVRVAKVAHRYVQHFHPRYLFVEADADEAVWATPFGLLPVYTLPGLIAGLAYALPRVRQSAPCRLLLLGVVLYPIADAFNRHVSLHNQRASAGLWILFLVAGFGVSAVARFLTQRRLWVSTAAAGTALLALIVPEQMRFTRAYFYNRAAKPTVYYGTHQDLLAACHWLRPHLDGVDAVLCFADGPVLGYTPWVVTLVALQYDPRRWFCEPRVLDDRGAWDRYVRFGKFWFLHPDERQQRLAELTAGSRRQRVILLLRPEEPLPCAPAHVVRDPSGQPAAIICDCELGGST